MNNSYDDLKALPRIKLRYLDKLENELVKNINSKITPKFENKSKKKVKFCEEENKFIEINQNNIATKFSVYNNIGKKIYFKKCNMDNYMKILKNKKYNLKSILIYKKEEKVDNSEWDKLYDIINQIVKRNNNEKNNSGIKVKNSFKIKNIESFKKKRKKSTSKNKKIKK